MSDSANESDIDFKALSSLEEDGKYMRYLETVESYILRWNSKTLHMDEHSDLKQKLWRHLAITSNIFATRLIEKRRYARAMGKVFFLNIERVANRSASDVYNPMQLIIHLPMKEVLEKTLSLISSDIGFLPKHMCEELSGMAKDTFAYYYMCRSKYSASLQYLISAINIYKRQNDAFNIAKCRLHESFILCAQNKSSKSMESLCKILTMVENGSLDIESDNNQVLLLVSVTYHNIAVQQLMLGHICDACVSSQNARRLARLCLSVSIHYVPMLESTHKQSLNALSSVLKNSQSEAQTKLFHYLITELFD